MSQLGAIIAFCAVCYAATFSATKGYIHAKNTSR